VRIELEIERILPSNYSFQGGDRPYLLQIGLFSEVEGTRISLKKSICVRSRSIYHIFAQLKLS
jgi:hypothetical protein